MRYIFILGLFIVGLVCNAQDIPKTDSLGKVSAKLISAQDTSVNQISDSVKMQTAPNVPLPKDGIKSKLDFDKNGILLWVIISLLLLNLVFSVFLLFRMIKKNKNMDINELNEKFNKFCLEIEDRIAELRDEIVKNRKYIDEKLSDQPLIDHKLWEGNNAKASEMLPLVPNKDICYAYTSVDGYFVDLMKDMSNAIAYFKLELENDYGKYMIIDNDNPEMQKQMVTDGYPNIAPCVEEQNSRNEWKSGIETVDVGKVTKDERGWKISKKTIIRYK